MSVKYRAKEGETLDLICWHIYGRCTGGTVEQVLDANPGLAQLGPVLPVGTLVTLPEITKPEAELQVGLW